MFNINFGLSVGGPRIGAAASGTEPTSGVSSATTQGWFTRLLGGGPTKSGARVNAETAMAISANYRCMQILSGTVAMLPLTLYKRKGNDDRERAIDHPAYRLMRISPNGRQTAFNWKRATQGNLSMRGNGFGEIIRDGRGRLEAIRPISADVVTVRRHRETGNLFYDTPDEQGIPARRMLHLRNFSFDGDVGLSTISLARETMGLALTTEAAGAEAFGKGVVPPVIISVKGSPDPAQRKKYRDDWVELYAGQRYAPAVVGEMLKVEQLKMNLEDMQFLQSRKFQILEICRWYGVPPHKLYELDRATFSNIEHQGIEWLQDSIDPILVNWESQLNMSLLSDAEQGDYYFEFNREALLRTDTLTRFQAYKLAREIGALNVDEIRSAENRSSVPGGNVYLEPMNMRPLGSASTEPVGKESP